MLSGQPGGKPRQVRTGGEELLGWKMITTRQHKYVIDQCRVSSPLLSPPPGMSVSWSVCLSGLYLHITKVLTLEMTDLFCVGQMIDNER